MASQQHSLAEAQAAAADRSPDVARGLPEHGIRYLYWARPAVLEVHRAGRPTVTLSGGGAGYAASRLDCLSADRAARAIRLADKVCRD